MDPNSFATNAPRKVRFAPKAPPTRVQKPVVSKVEKVDDDADAAQAQELLRRFNESALNVKPKTERKVGATQVAFGQGGSASSIKSYGAHPNVKSSQNMYPGATAAAKNRVDKEYKEPWDYYSYYPVTLPLRMPYSGDPELLDEAEFGDASESQTYDEGSSNAAVQLGLMDENPEPTMLFLQLPSKLPMPKERPSTDTDVKEAASNKSKSSNSKGGLFNDVYTLGELPAGFMGKLVVYKSGAVKLKIGDNLYDVATGVDSTFAQDVVVINAKEERCCAVGELNKRAIITPDLDSMFDNKFDP